MPPSVLLCDDHLLLVEALAGILNANGFTDVGTAASPQIALRLLAERPFDVCVLDISFPDADGLSALPAFRRLLPEMKVLILSAIRDRNVVADALAAGALGFCRKDAGVAQILTAIQRVADGELVLDASLVRNVAMAAKENDDQRLVAFLTDREMEVLGRLAAGESTELVARGMGVTKSTARSHIQSILIKLGVHSRLEAVALASRAGLRLPLPRHCL